MADLIFTQLDSTTCSVAQGGKSPTDLHIPTMTEEGYSVDLIEHSAFAFSSTIQTVFIEEGITEIDDEAFRECTALKSVVLPKSLKRIGWGAFADCALLSSIEFPEGLEIVDEYAFAGCKSIGSVSLPNSVNVADNAFTNKETPKFVFPGQASERKGLKAEITGDESCAIKAGFSPYPFAHLPRSMDGFRVTSVANSGFQGKYIRELKIPYGVVSIGSNAFRNCTHLDKIQLPNGLKSIGARAFKGTAFNRVKLPNSLTEIGDGAFASSAITDIYLPYGLRRLGKGAFANSRNLTEIVIEGTTKVIGADCFSGCKNLKEVHLGCGIERIEKGAFNLKEKLPLPVRIPLYTLMINPIFLIIGLGILSSSTAPQKIHFYGSRTEWNNLMSRSPGCGLNNCTPIIHDSN